MQLIFISVKAFLEGLHTVLYVPYFSVFISFFGSFYFSFGVRILIVPMHGVQRRMISVDNFFVFLRLLFFCFVVAIPSARCGNYISPLLCANSIWKSFLKFE